MTPIKEPANRFPIQVTAAIIIREDKFLIARRNRHKHMGGRWEFPGGKIKPGETPEACLGRELEEEFGIRVSIRQFFHRQIHHYPEKSIELISFFVDWPGGEMVLTDHEEIRWITPAESAGYRFADADIPIVRKLLTHFPGAPV